MSPSAIRKAMADGQRSVTPELGQGIRTFTVTDIQPPSAVQIHYDGLVNMAFPDSKLVNAYIFTKRIMSLGPNSISRPKKRDCVKRSRKQSLLSF